MYRKISTLCLLILGALSGCSNSVSNRNQSDPSGDLVRAGISQAWSNHIEAARRKDLPGVMAMYADDVVYSVNRASTSPGRIGASMTSHTDGHAVRRPGPEQLPPKLIL
ncbi:MAG: hypothetical protein ACREBC_11210 [Pyrinomonadaceae bacterium]